MVCFINKEFFNNLIKLGRKHIHINNFDELIKMITDLIEQLGYEEFLQLSIKLKNMLQEHISWLKNIQKQIICDFPVTDELLNEVKSCNNCKAGEWYYSVSETALLTNEDFIKIGENHKDLHNIAYKLLSEYSKNNCISSKTYDNFSHIHDIFFDSFQSFVKKIEITQNQYDYLTKLPNRKSFNLILNKEFQRLQRSNEKCCIVLADIDHFKNINDNHGHKSGDIALIKIAAIFLENMRKFDSVGRYGGEEFIFCLPNTTSSQAYQIVERIRKSIESTIITVNENCKLNLTCSFGIAEIEKDVQIQQSIDKADKALYRAKNLGRNQIQ